MLEGGYFVRLRKGILEDKVDSYYSQKLMRESIEKK
jgi:hypothetical protein